MIRVISNKTYAGFSVVHNDVVLASTKIIKHDSGENTVGFYTYPYTLIDEEDIKHYVSAVNEIVSMTNRLIKTLEKG